MLRKLSSCIVVVLAFLFTSAQTAGQPPENRTGEEVRKTLLVILTKPDDEKLAGKAADRAEALRRLKAYRYLAGVPYKDLTLDDDYNEASEAGARLCAKIGRLDHTPKNPGWPEDEYKLAYRGTSRSNLAMGYRDLVKSLDGWMDDSDKFNIDRLGHRRWCLHPPMKKVGFGASGRFHVMYAFDMSRKNVPDYEFVAWPPRGLIPVSFFSSDYAWSLSLNPRKYDKPGKSMKPKVYRVDANGKKLSGPLALNYFNVDNQGFAIPNCIIFRPKKIEIRAGNRFMVEVEGVRLRRQRKETTVRYVVTFVANR